MALKRTQLGGACCPFASSEPSCALGASTGAVCTCTRRGQACTTIHSPPTLTKPTQDLMDACKVVLVTPHMLFLSVQKGHREAPPTAPPAQQNKHPLASPPSPEAAPIDSYASIHPRTHAHTHTHKPHTSSMFSTVSRRFVQATKGLVRTCPTPSPSAASTIITKGEYTSTNKYRAVGGRESLGCL